MKTSMSVATKGSGHKIALTARDGNRIPIVFLHGNGFGKEIFANQFNSEILRDHAMITLDLPGHGQSDDASDPKNTYTYQGMARAISKALQSQLNRPCIVAGWSLGGHVALEMLDDPMVAGAVAFGTPPAPAGPIGLIRAFHINRMLLLAGKSSFSEAEAVYFEQAALGDHANGAFVERLLRTDPMMRPTLSRSILMGSGFSQRDRILQSEKPICLMNGETDLLVRAPYMQTLESPALYGGLPIVLPDCGHAPFLQNQQAFETILDRFADGVENGSLKRQIPVPRELAMVG